MHGMLAFLLFAGALHVNWPQLKRRMVPVAVMATLGVVISTFVVGVGFWGLARLFGLEVPLAWALVFGALISPTDPVAVLSLLKAVRVPQLLEIEMSGESLLNDGVGVVLFTILLAVAATGNNHVSVPGAAGLFLLEAFGGGVLGLVTGYIAYRAMRAIDDYVVEVFISLALVIATYMLAERLHISGPIAVVAAGLLIGERGPGRRHERKHAALSVRFLDAGRRTAQFGAVPADRSRIDRGRREFELRLAGAVRGAGGSAWRAPLSIGVPIYALSYRLALHQGHHPGADLGRRARRHFDRARLVAALCRAAADHPDRHLCRRPVHDHRAGADAEMGHSPHGAVVAGRVRLNRASRPLRKRRAA